MKLFLDQNLSFRMLKNLQGFFPGSRHVKDFGFTGDNDEDIWNFSAKNDFIIVSKDSDFLYRSLFRGHPPKTIHIQCGNSTPEFILNVILKNYGLNRLRRDECSRLHVGGDDTANMAVATNSQSFDHPVKIQFPIRSSYCRILLSRGRIPFDSQVIPLKFSPGKF